MKRRNFLGSLASTAVGLLPALTLAKSTVAKAQVTPQIAGINQAPSITAGFQRVRPSDAGWPDLASWNKLKLQANGTLSEVPGLFSACQLSAKNKECLDVVQQSTNPFWLGDQAGGTQNSGWLDAWSPAPSAYVIKAKQASEVASGIDFARKHHLRLVVKGGGHSYLGTSNAPDSLLIWTRAMHQVSLHDAFVPAGGAGKIKPQAAVTAGAGAVWSDLYHAVTTQAGRYVQGGGCMTVGVAGLVQSGGFNPFSKGFGTVAAGLLEAEIVTADGQVRVVNSMQDADLFWALKGGGGGSFGVVTRVTLRTHDLPEFFGAAWGKVQAHSDAAFARLIAHFMEFYQQSLFNPHWGEHVHFGADNVLEIDMLAQGLTAAEIATVWHSFFQWVQSQPEEYSLLTPFGSGAWAARSWWDVEKKSGSMIADPRQGAPKHHGWSEGDQGEVGIFLHGYDSLWLPAALLQKDQQATLCNALFAASRHQMVRLHFGKGLAGASEQVRAEARASATNPLVADAFTLVIIADGEAPPAYPGYPRAPVDMPSARQRARKIAQSAAELRKIAPHSGSYVSESNYFNSDWQKEYWGENYTRLRAIKDRYDPAGLFFVHHGVGSEDWSKDGFTRLVSVNKSMQQPIQ